MDARKLGKVWGLGEVIGGISISMSYELILLATRIDKTLTGIDGDPIL